MAFKCGIMPLTVLLLVVCILSCCSFGAPSLGRVLHRCSPLPEWLPAVATLLSPITIAALSFANTFLHRQWRSSSQSDDKNFQSRILTVVDQIHSILCAVVATAALAYLFPESVLSCNLDQQWQSYFRSKNAHAIRTIQDRFRCRGLLSIHDRAWPFRDGNHDNSACEQQFGYQQSCLVPWRQQQQAVSWMIFAAGALIWACKVGFVLLGHRQYSWMSRFSTSDVVDQRRIAHQDDGEHAEGDEEAARDPRRALLSHSESAFSNEWQRN